MVFGVKNQSIEDTIRSFESEFNIKFTNHGSDFAGNYSKYKGGIVSDFIVIQPFSQTSEEIILDKKLYVSSIYIGNNKGKNVDKMQRSNFIKSYLLDVLKYDLISEDIISEQ